MRIRKHMSKILGTSRPFPPTPPLSPVKVMRCPPMGYFCETNHSPWDVFPFDPQDFGMGDWVEEEEVSYAMLFEDEAPRATHEELNAMQEEVKLIPARRRVRKVKGKKVMMNKGTETPTTLSLSKEREEDEVLLKELIGTHGRRSRRINKKAEKAEEKNKFMKKETNLVEDVGSLTCKKTDGKQWRCKNVVEQPNSLCSYHLAKHLSYNDASADQTIKKKATATPAVADVYYYSSSGPWRGKHRGGTAELGSNGPAAVEVGEDHSDTGKLLERDTMYISKDEDSSEDSEEVENQKRSKKRKKKRRKVKLRSLESLM